MYKYRVIKHVTFAYALEIESQSQLSNIEVIEKSLIFDLDQWDGEIKIRESAPKVIVLEEEAYAEAA